MVWIGSEDFEQIGSYGVQNPNGKWSQAKIPAEIAGVTREANESKTLAQSNSELDQF